VLDSVGIADLIRQNAIEASLSDSPKYLPGLNIVWAAAGRIRIPGDRPAAQKHGNMYVQSFRILGLMSRGETLFLQDGAVQQQHLASIVESSDDAIISKDLNGIIQSWNRAAERIFGYTADEAIGKHISILAAPDRLDEIPDILKRISRGERVDHYQTEQRRKDGRILDISLTVSPIRDGFGTVIGASKIARDITEQKRDQRALQATNEALNRSNADLEQFAHSAAHDLQEPLRTISIYSNLLKRNVGATLDATGNEYLDHIRAASTRMQHLLRDLRILMQASAYSSCPLQKVDANDVLRTSLAILRAGIEESGAAITNEELPCVHMHEFQLDQLFQNLIGNAIRYRAQEPSRIHIAAERAGDTWKFSVRDNGIGIDPQYREHIFGMFKRLHGCADYPGTGMGLAICKRIIEQVGGRIWVESELGEGATFFFTVPIVEGPLQDFASPNARVDR